MAYKLQIINNFFRVTDTINSFIQLNEPKNDISFLPSKDGIFWFRYAGESLNGFGIQTRRSSMLGGDQIHSSPYDTTDPEKPAVTNFHWEECVDENDVPFVSSQALDDWLTTNLSGSNVNVIVEQLPPAPEIWHPRPLELGAWNLNGAFAFPATVGRGITFRASNNDEADGSTSLDFNGIDYAGQSMIFHLHWQLFDAVGGGSRNVIFELDYAFLADGLDNYVLSSGAVSVNEDVTGAPNREQRTTFFAPIAGPPNSTHLQLTLRRLGQGGGSDNYGGDADLYEMALINPTA